MTKESAIEWKTVQDVARMVGMSRNWVVEQIKAGKLKANRMGTVGAKAPCWRIDSREAERFHKTFEYKPTKQPQPA